jgi:hypothetical protein
MPPRTSRSLLLLALVALVAGSGGCVAKAKNPFQDADPANTRIAIYIENRGFNDVRVYAMTGRGTESLGVVGGNAQQRVTLEWRQMDPISFRIEVLAGRTYNTNGVAASPGDRVTLTIPSDPANSFVQVR